MTKYNYEKNTMISLILVKQFLVVTIIMAKLIPKAIINNLN